MKLHEIIRVDFQNEISPSRRLLEGNDLFSYTIISSIRRGKMIQTAIEGFAFVADWSGPV
jgi:hypothetical protein